MPRRPTGRPSGRPALPPDEKAARVTLAIPPTLLCHLDAESDRTGESRSAVAVRLLRLALENVEKNPPVA